jgi:hypothetical protein
MRHFHTPFKSFYCPLLLFGNKNSGERVMRNFHGRLAERNLVNLDYRYFKSPGAPSIIYTEGDRKMKDVVKETVKLYQPNSDPDYWKDTENFIRFLDFQQTLLNYSKNGNVRDRKKQQWSYSTENFHKVGRVMQCSEVILRHKCQEGRDEWLPKLGGVSTGTGSPDLSHPTFLDDSMALLVPDCYVAFSKCNRYQLDSPRVFEITFKDMMRWADMNAYYMAHLRSPYVSDSHRTKSDLKSNFSVNDECLEHVDDENDLIRARIHLRMSDHDYICTKDLSEQTIVTGKYDDAIKYKWKAQYIQKQRLNGSVCLPIDFFYGTRFSEFVFNYKETERAFSPFSAENLPDCPLFKTLLPLFQNNVNADVWNFGSPENSMDQEHVFHQRWQDRQLHDIILEAGNSCYESSFMDPKSELWLDVWENDYGWRGRRMKWNGALVNGKYKYLFRSKLNVPFSLHEQNVAHLKWVNYHQTVKLDPNTFYLPVRASNRNYYHWLEEIDGDAEQKDMTHPDMKMFYLERNFDLYAFSGMALLEEQEERGRRSDKFSNSGFAKMFRFSDVTVSRDSFDDYYDIYRRNSQEVNIYHELKYIVAQLFNGGLTSDVAKNIDITTFEDPDANSLIYNSVHRWPKTNKPYQTTKKRKKVNLPMSCNEFIIEAEDIGYYGYSTFFSDVYHYPNIENINGKERVTGSTFSIFPGNVLVGDGNYDTNLIRMFRLRGIYLNMLHRSTQWESVRTGECKVNMIYEPFKDATASPQCQSEYDSIENSPDVDASTKKKYIRYTLSNSLVPNGLTGPEFDSIRNWYESIFNEAPASGEKFNCNSTAALFYEDNGTSCTETELVNSNLFTMAALHGKSKLLFGSNAPKFDSIIAEIPGEGCTIFPGKIRVKWPFVYQCLASFWPLQIRATGARGKVVDTTLDFCRESELWWWLYIIFYGTHTEDAFNPIKGHHADFKYHCRGGGRGDTGFNGGGECDDNWKKFYDFEDSLGKWWIDDFMADMKKRYGTGDAFMSAVIMPLIEKALPNREIEDPPEDTCVACRPDNLVPRDFDRVQDWIAWTGIMNSNVCEGDEDDYGMMQWYSVISNSQNVPHFDFEKVTPASTCTYFNTVNAYMVDHGQCINEGILDHQVRNQMHSDYYSCTCYKAPVEMRGSGDYAALHGQCCEEDDMATDHPPPPYLAVCDRNTNCAELCYQGDAGVDYCGYVGPEGDPLIPNQITNQTDIFPSECSTHIECEKSCAKNLKISSNVTQLDAFSYACRDQKCVQKPHDDVYEQFCYDASIKGYCQSTGYVGTAPTVRFRPCSIPQGSRYKKQLFEEQVDGADSIVLWSWSDGGFDYRNEPLDQVDIDEGRHHCPLGSDFENQDSMVEQFDLYKNSLDGDEDWDYLSFGMCNKEAPYAFTVVDDSFTGFDTKEVFFGCCRTELRTGTPSWASEKYINTYGYKMTEQLCYNYGRLTHEDSPMFKTPLEIYNSLCIEYNFPHGPHHKEECLEHFNKLPHTSEKKQKLNELLKEASQTAVRCLEPPCISYGDWSSLDPGLKRMVQRYTDKIPDKPDFVDKFCNIVNVGLGIDSLDRKTVPSLNCIPPDASMETCSTLSRKRISQISSDANIMGIVTTRPMFRDLPTIQFPDGLVVTSANPFIHTRVARRLGGNMVTKSGCNVATISRPEITLKDVDLDNSACLEEGLLQMGNSNPEMDDDAQVFKSALQELRGWNTCPVRLTHKDGRSQPINISLTNVRLTTAANFRRMFPGRPLISVDADGSSSKSAVDVDGLYLSEINDTFRYRDDRDTTANPFPLAPLHVVMWNYVGNVTYNHITKDPLNVVSFAKESSAITHSYSSEFERDLTQARFLRCYVQNSTSADYEFVNWTVAFSYGVGAFNDERRGVPPINYLTEDLLINESLTVGQDDQGLAFNQMLNLVDNSGGEPRIEPVRILKAIKETTFKSDDLYNPSAPNKTITESYDISEFENACVEQGGLSRFLHPEKLAYPDYPNAPPGYALMHKNKPHSYFQNLLLCIRWHSDRSCPSQCQEIDLHGKVGYSGNNGSDVLPITESREYKDLAYGSEFDPTMEFGSNYPEGTYNGTIQGGRFFGYLNTHCVLRKSARNKLLILDGNDFFGKYFYLPLSSNPL